jgi:mannose-6-phosphate isomerase-like protein (cupin superfamily)
MKHEPKIKPKVTEIADWETMVYPDGTMTTIMNVKGVGAIGLYFMKPGLETIVFSTEEEDDGTADEWYGPVHEFYYILVGEFTVWWGKDASKLRNKNAEKLIIKEGQCTHYPPGWKYMVKNTGKIPGTFFWGISSPPKGTKPREIEAVREVK